MEKLEKYQQFLVEKKKTIKNISGAMNFHKAVSEWMHKLIGTSVFVLRSKKDIPTLWLKKKKKVPYCSYEFLPESIDNWPPAFSKKSGGTLFSAFRGAWFRIFSRYLVPLTPPTIFVRSFWNLTGAFKMVWRYACGFFRILKLFFITFYTFWT